MASIFARFFGRTVSEAAAFGAGVALGPTLAPVVRGLENETWTHYPVKPPDAMRMAAAVAEGKVDSAEAYTWASYNGYGKDAMDAMVAAATAGPALGLAYSGWRRGELSDAEFALAVKRLGIADRWLPALRALKADVLDPVQLANAIHRGLVPDPGLLAVPPPSGKGKVPAYPVYDVDPLHEAASSGIDRTRLGVLVGLMGLPMGVHEAANAVFRKVITKTDFQRAVAESNTRNEWGDALFEQSRQIPTARDFLENALRGYRTLADAIGGAALHGMSTEHATMIYQNQGRPMAVRLITQALARGGKFKPEPGEIKDPYDAAIVEGSLKPAYYDLAKSLRYTMPSPFAIRQLATSKVWDEQTTRTRLLWLGWNPDDARDVAHAWAGGGGATADPHVAKAQVQLWTATHKAYVLGEIADTAARDDLAAAGVTTGAVDDVLTLWNRERELVRRTLSPAQVKKAFRDVLFDRDTAVSRLMALGYTADDAGTLLDE